MTTSANIELAPVAALPTQAAREGGAGRLPVRDRYIDSLRALALVRVVVYHLFGWAWLTVVFPSIPIMFALAGSLVASSLDRSPMNPWKVLAKRIRRLLPPLWMLGIVAVPVMLVFPWTYDLDTGIGSPLDWKTLLLWILPIADPPGSALGIDVTVALWYIRAYLWFLILSPAALWLFRRWPARTMAVPLIGLILGTIGIWDLTATAAGEITLTMITYGACWLLGFAHHDNLIRTTPLRTVVPTALILMAVGLGYALTHQTLDSSYDLDEIPFAIALWGLGAVLLLLRFYPDFSWLARIPVLDKLVTAINARAMTIYLWNNPAIALAGPVAQLFTLTRQWDVDGTTLQLAQQFIITWILIIAAILLFGWVEDVAANRRFRINPWPRNKPGKTAEASPESGARRLVLTAASTPKRVSGTLVTLLPKLSRHGSISPRLPRTPVRRPIILGVVAAAVLAIVAALAVQQGWTARAGSQSVTSAPAAAAQSATGAGLPSRVVSGYWQGWGNPAIRLRDVPESYNTVMVAFAVGSKTGKATFTQSVQTPASFVADVDTLTQSGRKVLLSVGGAEDGGLTITTDKQRKTFVDSIIPIIDTYHFQGIDWDLEHGIDPAQIAAATRDLTKHYGPDFLVTMAPMLTGTVEDQQLDLAARIKTELDLVSPQFYNGGQTDAAWIVNRTLAWAAVVGQDKIAMGFMTTETSTDTGVQTTSHACAIWAALLERAPQARGLMTWSINLDQKSGYDFARNCAPRVVTN